MQTTIQDTNDRFSVVAPKQIHGSVGPADPETLGIRVLELANMLQTTLELDQQIALFAQAIQDQVDIDGLEYENTVFGKTLSNGSTATHRASYELKLKQDHLGTLRFYRAIPFTNRELKLLENLLCALIYPIRNALAYLEALQLAAHDPLTGIQNRLALESALTREVDLARRQQTPLSLLIIDADHFKHFNDEFGHTFGDDVLRALANAIAATIRRSDLVFRFGGEEFVVLTSHTDRQGATLLAERIREAVNHIRTVRGRDISLSVSIGLAELSADEPAEDFFERADKALYQAKNGGRNRVVAS